MANKRIKRLLISRGYWDSQRLYTWTHVHFIIIKKKYIYIFFAISLCNLTCFLPNRPAKVPKIKWSSMVLSKKFLFQLKKSIFFFFKTIVINLTMYGLGKRIEHVDPTVSVYIYMSSCLSIRKRKKNYVNVSCFSSLLLLFSKILCLYYYLLFFI